MALILNIETSTTVCSVALAENGKIIALKKTRDENSHSRILTVFIEDIFKETNIDIKKLDAVAVSKGPGSYTGLRIGVSAAKGIAYGLNIPLISVNTLQIMALQLKSKYNEFEKDENIILSPMIDARRMEVYTALFDKNLNMKTEISADIIDENSYETELINHKIFFFGNGADKLNKIIKHKNAVFIEDIHPSADYMIEFSEKKFESKTFEDTAYFEPFYLKNFVAVMPTKHIYG